MFTVNGFAVLLTPSLPLLSKEDIMFTTSHLTHVLTFIVHVNAPRYHHSTDAYMGHSRSVAEAFSTIAEAVAYVQDMTDGDELGVDDEVFYQITVLKTYSDLTISESQPIYWPRVIGQEQRLLETDFDDIPF